jgi:hypothetical protein
MKTICNTLLAASCGLWSFYGSAQSCTLTIAPSHTAVCPGFSSTLTAFGVSSYTWTGTSFTGAVSGSSIAVGPGSYTVLGTSPTCTLTQTITIGFAPSLVISLTISSPTTCLESNFPAFSKPVTLTASGASSYAWFPYDPAMMSYSIGPVTTVRPKVTTCYTVVGSTSNCSGQNSICITVIPQYTIQLAPSQKTVCIGEAWPLSVAAVGTLAAAPGSAWMYEWTEPNSAIGSLNSYFSATVIAAPPGPATYTAEMLDGQGCISEPATVFVDVKTCQGINELPGAVSVHVYPNPSGGEINVTSVIDREVKLISVSGRLVNRFTLDASNGRSARFERMPGGIYFLIASDGSAQKLVIVE